MSPDFNRGFMNLHFKSWRSSPANASLASIASVLSACVALASFVLATTAVLLTGRQHAVWTAEAAAAAAAAPLAQRVQWLAVARQPRKGLSSPGQQAYSVPLPPLPLLPRDGRLGPGSARLQRAGQPCWSEPCFESAWAERRAKRSEKSVQAQKLWCSRNYMACDTSGLVTAARNP